MKLPVIPADKANHALYGLILFALIGAIAAAADTGPPFAGACGFVGSTLIGVGKELGARLAPRRGVEATDALATSLGAGLGWFTAYVLG